MLGFLRSVWNFFSGGVSELWHWILNLFGSVWTYIYHMWDALVADISSAIHYAKALFDYISSWVVHVIDNVSHLIDKIAIDIEHWAAGLINRLTSFVNSMYHWVIQQLDNLIHAIEKAYSDIEHWMVSSIWNPLFNFIRTALNWIEREGSQMWNLLTHPDKLFSLLASYVWRAWLQILQAFAVPVTGFIINQLRGFIPELISLAEDIISKVL